MGRQAGPLRMRRPTTDITERKVLEQAERDQRRLAEALRDAAAALNSTLKLEEVLDRILDSIGKIAAYDAVIMVMLEGDEARSSSANGACPSRRRRIAGDQAHYRLSDLPLLGPFSRPGCPVSSRTPTADPTCAPGCRMVAGDALLSRASLWRSGGVWWARSF